MKTVSIKLGIRGTPPVFIVSHPIYDFSINTYYFILTVPVTGTKCAATTIAATTAVVTTPSVTAEVATTPAEATADGTITAATTFSPTVADSG